MEKDALIVSLFSGENLQQLETLVDSTNVNTSKVFRSSVFVDRFRGRQTRIHMGTLLFNAIKREQVDLVEFVLRKGANVTSNDLSKALYEDGSIDIIRLLFARSTPEQITEVAIKLMNTYKQGDLFDVISWVDGRIDILSEMLLAGVNFNDERFHKLLIRMSSEDVDFFLHNGMDVDFFLHNGMDVDFFLHNGMDVKDRKYFLQSDCKEIGDLIEHFGGIVKYY